MKYTPEQIKRQANGFIFSADDFLATILPAGWSHKQLVSVKNNIVKETTLMAETTANIVAMGLKSKTDIKTTIKDFAKKYGTGLANTDVSRKLPHGQNLLRNRVENDLLYENAKNMEGMYPGRKFIWLPSGAKEPRHTHMLRYGKVFEVGGSVLPDDDNFPGKAYGCKCGYQWVEEPATTYSTFDEKYVDIQKYVRTRKIEDESPSANLMSKIGSKEVSALLTPSAIKSARKQLEKTYDGTTVLKSVQWWQDNNTATKFVDTSKPATSAAQKEAQNDLLNPMNYLRSQKAMTVYRGTTLNTTTKALKIGSKVKLNRPTFVTMDKDVATKFTRGNKQVPVKFAIQMKKGVKFIPSYAVSSYPEEAELLLAPLSTFKVVNILNKNGRVPTIVLQSIAGKGKFTTIQL